MMNVPYAILQISGNDRERFLQGQLTCDVRQVRADQCTFSALCNSKGRVIASGWLTKKENVFLWILPETLMEIAQTALEKYARFSAVEFTPSPSSLQVILMGNDANTFQLSVLENSPLMAKTTFNSAIWEKWQLACIRQGVAVISSALSGQFTPHELAYPFIGAVSFDKGCYLGQEIIARMHYRGALKKHLHYIKQSTQVFHIGAPLENIDPNSCVINCVNDEALVVANDEAIKKAHAQQQIEEIKIYA